MNSTEVDKQRHRWIAHLDYRWLVPLALLTALAPWPAGPTPHLVEKIGWLVDGRLNRFIDWFDLFFHGSASLLLLMKLAHDLVHRRKGKPVD